MFGQKNTSSVLLSFTLSIGVAIVAYIIAIRMFPFHNLVYILLLSIWFIFVGKNGVAFFSKIPRWGVNTLFFTGIAYLYFADNILHAFLEDDVKSIENLKNFFFYRVSVFSNIGENFDQQLNTLQAGYGESKRNAFLVNIVSLIGPATLVAPIFGLLICAGLAHLSGSTFVLKKLQDSEQIKQLDKALHVMLLAIAIGTVYSIYGVFVTLAVDDIQNSSAMLKIATGEGSRLSKYRSELSVAAVYVSPLITTSLVVLYVLILKEKLNFRKP